MATTHQHSKTKPHHRFPRKLGRFLNLEGGLYGTLDLVALTAEQLELQTGEDFLRFDREQAANLRDTIDKFLTLEKAPLAVGEGEVLVEEEEVEAAELLEQKVVTRPKRRHRPKPQG